MPRDTCGPADPSDIVIARLTRHFIDRWTERVGAAPTLESVRRKVADGIVIRRQQLLWKRVGKDLTPRRLLTEVWNHRMGIIIRIDERRQTAVTLIAPR